MKYDISYNIPDDKKVEDCFTNANELKQYLGKPIHGLTENGLDSLLQKIPGALWYQYAITEWNDDDIQEDGLPDLIWQGNAVEWVYK